MVGFLLIFCSCSIDASSVSIVSTFSISFVSIDIGSEVETIVFKEASLEFPLVGWCGVVDVVITGVDSTGALNILKIIILFLN